jgi:hypothetical protein
MSILKPARRRNREPAGSAGLAVAVPSAPPDNVDERHPTAGNRHTPKAVPGSLMHRLAVCWRWTQRRWLRRSEPGVKAATGLTTPSPGP